MKSSFLFLMLLIFNFCHSQNPTEEQIIDQFDKIEIADAEAKNLDVIKNLTEQSKKLNFTAGTLRGLVLLQRCTLMQNDYILSGKYSEESELLATKVKDYYVLSLVHMYRGKINIILDKYPEAKAELNKALSYGKKIENDADRHIQLCRTYATFAGMYEGLNNSKGWFESTEKSLNFIKTTPIGDLTEYQKSRYYYLYIFELMNMGSYYIYGLKQPDFKLAEPYFKKMLTFEKLTPKYFKICEIDIYDSLSDFYFKKEDFLKAIEYSQKILDAEKSNKNPRYRLFAYINLKDIYGSMKNKEEENTYLKLYTQLNDSINFVEKKTIIQQSRDQISKSDISNERSRKSFLLVVIIIVLIIAGGAWFLINQKNKTHHRRYEDLMARMVSDKTKEGIRTIEAKSSVVITDETAKILLLKLEKFETSEKYLRKDLSLTWLANNLNTNTKYLSEVIKIYREHNFTGYINELRIHYIIKKLYENPIYREYKITYLAEECGYVTPRVFVNAFKQQTGFTPSYFVEQLKVSVNV